MVEEDLKARIGQLFVTGFDTETPTAQFLRFGARANLGGVILFEEQCRNPVETRSTIDLIRSRSPDSRPLVAIDQEGGRVCRLKGAPAEIDAAAQFGESRAVERFAETYTRAAVYMESLGINLNLAPVADIFLNESNQCLESRCFGKDAGSVSLFVTMWIGISRACGLLSCLKHFPGLGAAEIDPHRATAVADYTLEQWRSRELIPFQDGIGRGAELVMTTHLRLPKIDETIATGSHKIVQGMLRGELGFDGPVITDDLTMAGACELGDVGERAIRAFDAGHDLLLFGREWTAAEEAHHCFVTAYEKGEIDPQRLAASLDRVWGLKYKLGQPAL